MTDRFVTVPDSLELPAAVKVPSARLSDSTAAGRALLAGADAAAQRASLGLDTAAEWWGSRMGLRYDGTDETATVQSILNAMSAYGGGTLHLEGLVRCDGQVTIPTVLVAHQLRQAPLRITGAVQTQPGSVFFSEVTPYPKMGGFDLRYNGRTDTGCSTTLGSEVVLNPNAQASDRGLIVTGPGIPDQAWIMSVDPGVSWSLYRPARATATVALNSAGGRIQAYGYGTLELDHLQLVSGGDSTAPLVASTATTVIAHDNLMVGAVGKLNGTCDEDAFVLGGPGQGTRLTAPLTSGQTYTSLTVAPLPVGVSTGRKILIGAGTATQQEVTLSSAASAGATSLAVSSFTASANHAVGRTVYLGYAQSQLEPTSWTVPSCPFQGYGTEITRNHFHRLRRISIGGFASSLSISRNAWMHNTGSNLAATPSLLTAALTVGVSYDALPVSALSRPVLAGDIIQTGVADVGNTAPAPRTYSQEWVATADAAVGATSISVAAALAAATIPSGAKVINTTDGIGAAIESYAIGPEVNTPLVSQNRVNAIGYTHQTRFSGCTQQGVIWANDCQDVQSAQTWVAAHRFDRAWSWGASFNLVVPSLLASRFVLDDWSLASGARQQTLLSHDQTQPAIFSQGIDTVGEFSTLLPTPGGISVMGPLVALPSGRTFQWVYTQYGATLKHRAPGGSLVETFRVEDSSPNLNVYLAGTGEARLRNDNGHLVLRAKAGSKVMMGDGATPVTVVQGDGITTKHLKTVPVATASRPGASTAGAGTMIYDSTLSKPIWSDGTVWRDASGAAV